MTCGFCGHEFREEVAQRGGCRACFKAGSNCGMMKCPRCGYDVPRDIPGTGRFKEWLGKWGRLWRA